MQKELFRDLKSAEEIIEPLNSEHGGFFERIRIVLTLDKIILWALINITAIVFVYSFGVEQGTKAGKAEQRSVAESFAPEATTVASLVAEPQALVEIESPVQSSELETSPDAGLIVESPSADPERPLSGFTIQLATYKTEEYAKKEVAKLAQKGHKAFILPSGKLFQVCLDSFKSRQEAMKKLLDLRTDGFQKIYHDAYVRPVKK